jgi:hypothetical protein
MNISAEIVKNRVIINGVSNLPNDASVMCSIKEIDGYQSIASNEANINDDGTFNTYVEPS